MKKLYFLTIALFCMMIVFQSCSKQSVKELIAQPSTPNVINVIIAPDQSYVFNANNSATVSIERQASHYKISNLSPDSKSGLMVYQYLPAQGFTGKDEVVLNSKTAIYSSSNNAGNCNSSHVSDNPGSTSYASNYTTIRFTIGN